MTITVPGLGSVTEDGEWLVTDPRHVPVLGKPGRFIIDGYEPQEPAGLVACIEAFCSLGGSELTAVSHHVFAYYRDIAAEVAGEPGFPEISDPARVWDFVTLTNQPLVQLDDGTWFVVLENECDWEPEHGLVIVFKDGRDVVKVSDYDGHLTNRHAFADDSIPEDAVYWNPSSRR
jgi:hypothetical protein